MRILIAEDNPLLGQNLKKSLEKYHYAVDLATNGEDAAALGVSIPYDLLILDILLPMLNGFEVCRHLRDHKRTYPILMLTALDSARARADGTSSGLGLAIVEWIIHAHNGTITVESQPGQGSTFFVTWPLAPAKPALTSSLTPGNHKLLKDDLAIIDTT